jgi:hypothetical protein
MDVSVGVFCAECREYGRNGTKAGEMMTAEGKELAMAMDVTTVAAVLLQDGWYDVTVGTFSVGADGLFTARGISVPATANIINVASWTGINGDRVYCPVTSIIAVRQKKGQQLTTTPESQ